MFVIQNSENFSENYRKKFVYFFFPFDFMEPEKDDGNIEYKLKLLDTSDNRIERLASQMRFRCNEGAGECFYNLGVEDDGSMTGLTQTEYCNKYELWMDSAVSYLINEIDNIAAPTILFFNTNENEKLFFDMFLTSKNVCKKTRIYVNRFCKDYDGNITIFEFFVDTAIHDSGVW